MTLLLVSLAKAEQLLIPWGRMPTPLPLATPTPTPTPTLTQRDAFRLRAHELEPLATGGGPDAEVARAELNRRAAKRGETAPPANALHVDLHARRGHVRESATGPVVVAPHRAVVHLRTETPAPTPGTPAQQWEAATRPTPAQVADQRRAVAAVAQTLDLPNALGRAEARIASLRDAYLDARERAARSTEQAATPGTIGETGRRNLESFDDRSAKLAHDAQDLRAWMEALREGAARPIKAVRPAIPATDPAFDEALPAQEAKELAASVRLRGQKLIDKNTDDATRTGLENTHRRERMAAGRRETAGAEVDLGKRLVTLADRIDAGDFAPNRWDAAALASTRAWKRAAFINREDREIGEGSTSRRRSDPSIYVAAGAGRGDSDAWDAALKRKFARYRTTKWDRDGYQIPYSDGPAITAVAELIGKHQERLKGTDYLDRARDTKARISLGFQGTDDHIKIAERFRRLRDASGAGWQGGGPKYQPADRTRNRAPLEERIAAAEEVERKRFKAPAHAKIPGYFPTPPPVAAHMVDLLDAQPGDTVLEPSAGTGELADQLPGDVAITVAEHSSTLREVLKQKGYAPLSDGLGVAEQFDRVIMNPPFEDGADMEHVRRAFEANLKPGGRLVAIVGAGALQNSRRVNDEFRAFVSEHGYVARDLPSGTFARSGTGVASVILVLDK